MVAYDRLGMTSIGFLEAEGEMFPNEDIRFGK